jgi:hypothetical protein
MSGDLEVQAFLVFSLILGGLIAILLLFLFLGWKREVIRGNRSPYANAVMQFGSDIAKSLQKHINACLDEYPEVDNPQIDFSKAALCPVTGRIFTNCVVRGKTISLDWTFIQKRFQGTFLSWGILSEEEKGVIRVLHSSLEGFQMENSSALARPERVEKEFALLSPGPLYIDRKTNILMGWKLVPGTSFEILIVQRPLFQSLDDTL